MSKHTYPPVDGSDILTALVALATDTGCKGRIIVQQKGDSAEWVEVVAEAYTDHGAKIGVARWQGSWRHASAKSLMGLMLLAVHHVYQQAFELSHSAPALGSRKRGR